MSDWCAVAPNTKRGTQVMILLKLGTKWALVLLNKGWAILVQSLKFFEKGTWTAVSNELVWLPERQGCLFIRASQSHLLGDRSIAPLAQSLPSLSSAVQIGGESKLLKL